MTVERHRAIETPPGPARSPAFAFALAAALLLGGASAAAEPTPRPQVKPTEVAPGATAGGRAFEMFENAGTNPRYTDAAFSPTKEWHDPVSGIQGHGGLWVKPKTTDELNALPSPPPSPFTVDVTVTMVNDEGETASGTWRYRTTYARASTPAPAPLPPGAPPADPSPSSAGLERQAPPGTLVIVKPAQAFENAGTHPIFTDAVFSTTEYYEPDIGIYGGSLWVKARSSSDLLAMIPQPPNPLTVTAEVTMTNDEGDTASGKVTFVTEY